MATLLGDLMCIQIVIRTRLQNITSMEAYYD